MLKLSYYDDGSIVKDKDSSEMLGHKKKNLQGVPRNMTVGEQFKMYSFIIC